MTEAWIDFNFSGHRFTINNQLDEWWFFVSDPSCPEDLLHRVIDHFARVLGK